MPVQKHFTLTIETPQGDRTFEIDAHARPDSGSGQAGSILDMALALDVDIDHACGGVSACSTCHVYVKEGLGSCNAADDSEEDQLDRAPALAQNSRLACQCVPSGETNIRIAIPKWNRNLVREGR